MIGKSPEKEGKRKSLKFPENLTITVTEMCKIRVYNVENWVYGWKGMKIMKETKNTEKSSTHGKKIVFSRKICEKNAKMTSRGKKKIRTQLLPVGNE